MTFREIGMYSAQYRYDHDNALCKILMLDIDIEGIDTIAAIYLATRSKSFVCKRTVNETLKLRQSGGTACTRFGKTAQQTSASYAGALFRILFTSHHIKTA